MNAIDVFCWIVIIGAFLFVGFLGISACWMARKWDDIEEEQWREFCEMENKRMQDKAQKKYERYRERFANDYGKTIEEATECQAVKNYKEYLEEQYKEHGVQICEEVGES